MRLGGYPSHLPSTLYTTSDSSARRWNFTNIASMSPAMTVAETKEQVAFDIISVPDCILEPLKAGGFGEGSKWDTAAQKLIELHDIWAAAKVKTPDINQALLGFPFFGKEPKEARAWVQDQLTNRVRKMTEDRTVEQGGGLRVAARVGWDKETRQPVGIRAWALLDLERVRRPRKKKDEPVTGTTAGV